VQPIEIITAFIVLLTYAGVAFGQIPRLRMNRATIALVGAAALIFTGALTEQQALASIDTGTILLLAAMMVINVNLRLARFFGFISSHVLRLARTPDALLALVILASGVLSAFLLNDTICLMLTPLIVDLTRRLGRNPVPYLIGLATATNVGSTATITGNPQNLIIGQSSGIPYLTFMAYLAPVALVGLAICWLVIILIYRDEFRTPLTVVELSDPIVFSPLLTRTIVVLIGLIIAFLVGFPVVSSACVAAGLLLISRLKPGKLLNIDWQLLAFFGGLFVVTGAIEVTGLSAQLFDVFAPVLRAGVAPLTLATAALSNVVSNVPAVLLLRPEIPTLPNPQQSWLVLAMASTLSGNLTLLGSAATLIVAELAAARGARLDFMPYLRAGIPITVLTVLVGVVWLSLVT
jgi:Na+/H+ antiporter NhaD/arsenite permease-like protein